MSQVEAGNKARTDLEQRAAADAATAKARAADERAASERTRADLEARLAEASARGEGLAARCAALEAELAAKMAHAEQLAGKIQVCHLAQSRKGEMKGGVGRPSPSRSKRICQLTCTRGCQVWTDPKERSFTSLMSLCILGLAGLPQHCDK